MVKFCCSQLSGGGLWEMRAARVVYEILRDTEQDARDAVLPFVPDIVTMCRTTGDAQSLEYGTGVLWMLSVNDKALRVIVESSGLPLLVRLLSHKVRPLASVCLYSTFAVLAKRDVPIQTCPGLFPTCWQLVDYFAACKMLLPTRAQLISVPKKYFH